MNCSKITSKERDELKKEARRLARQVIVEDQKRYSMDVDSVALWVLHKRFGFGKQRLREFWDSFFAELKLLQEHYLTESGEADGYFCRVGLKSIGVDLEEWYREKEKEI